MLRLIGTILTCVALVFALGSSAALAYDSPQQYGVEFRGGFGIYDMGDITSGIETLQANLDRANIPNTLNENDNGLSGGLSLLYRPSKHTLWEVGYNALLDVENSVDTTPDTSSGQILMHANEFFVKGNLVALITDRLHLDLGGGIAYYNTELQVQDRKAQRYFYDAVGRGWGLIGSAGLEFLVTNRIGLSVQGGGRVVNTSNFVYNDSRLNQRVGLTVIDGTRPIEVNLSGAFANVGLRFYFDRVTKPVDFTR